VSAEAAEQIADVRAPARHAARLRALALLILVADAVVLSCAVVLGWDLRYMLDVWSAGASLPGDRYPAAGPWLVLAWLVVLGAQGAYSSRIFGNGPAEFRAVGLASLITAGMVGMFCYLVQIPLSRGFVLLTFAVGAPLLMLERYAVRKALHRLRVHGRMLHRVIAVGGPTGVGEIVSVLERERYAGYRVVGACLPPGAQWDTEAAPVPVVGSTRDVREVCERVGADTVLVARGGYDSSRELRRIAWALEGSDVDLVVVPSLTDIAGPRISMRPVAGLPLLHVEQPQAGEAGGLSKRLFDIVTAGVLLLLVSPVLAAVALAVKLHDGGPVLFRQRRIGRSGTPFQMLKFRSMVVDAERQLDQVRERNEHDGVLFKIRKDPRVTPVGTFLRKYSLDELPQLVNVLRGDMSLVGPRPPLANEVERYHDDVRRRLLVRPGITGLWQVSGRSELSWDETVRLDLYYVDNWSMLTDLVIMAKTLRAVLRGSGAY
jgi:exopolysaccharide biosynthesis polyprenyl glycosylphosphotransferase